jgi:YegS/Rv2252/BmrU family lipid kinase
MSRRAALIVNPAAGGGRAGRRLPRVEEALRARGVPFRTHRTASLGHAADLASDACAAGEVAVAMGGDGLVGTVAGALLGTQGVLGVLPGGRGNDFVRMLGISQDPEAACDVIASGVERAVDVAQVDGRAFVGIASAGFDSDVQDIANTTRLVRGKLVYLYSALRALAAWQPARFWVELDGERREFIGYAVAVANSRVFGGGMYLAPGAEIDDGLLDVVLTGQAGRLTFLRNLPSVFKGTHVDQATVEVLRAREVAFGADRPFTVYADGDPIAELPATVVVRPRSLSVLGPAGPGAPGSAPVGPHP